MSVQYGSVDSDGQSKMVLMGVCGQRREHVLLLCAAASCCAAHFEKRKLGSDLSREPVSYTHLTLPTICSV